MAITDSREHFKPFEYPWAFDAYHTQQQMHWLPSEVPLSEDVSDWKYKLTPEEKNLMTQIFRFFTQGDVDIAQGYLEKYIPRFKAPEVRMMLSTFASFEAIHAHAYSLLLDTLGLPETEYKAFREYQEMCDKHDYLFADHPELTDTENIVRDIAVFSAFGEGLQLFSSFAILLSFPKRGLLKGMGQIVSWSVRDESHHVDSMIRLYQSLLDEHPEVWRDDFKQHLYQAARDMVTLEDRFIDLCFAMGDIEGLTAQEVKDYVRYLADRRLLQLGLKPNYGIKVNPLPWVDYMTAGVEHANFFEARATEYARGSSTNWDDFFGS